MRCNTVSWTPYLTHIVAFLVIATVSFVAFRVPNNIWLVWYFPTPGKGISDALVITSILLAVILFPSILGLVYSFVFIRSEEIPATSQAFCFIVCVLEIVASDEFLNSVPYQ